MSPQIQTVVAALVVLVLVGFTLALAWWLWTRPASTTTPTERPTTQSTAASPGLVPAPIRSATSQELRESAQLAADRGDVAALERAIAVAEEARLSYEEFPAYRWDVQLHILRARAAWDARDVVSYFEGAPVYRDDCASPKRGTVEEGRLLFTERALVYVGDVRIEIPWTDVAHGALGDDERDGAYIAFQRRGKKSATRFYLPGENVAAGAFALSECLVRQAGQASAAAISEHTGSPVPPTAPPASAGRAHDALSDALADDEGLDFETDVVGESHDNRQTDLWAITRRAGQHPRDGVRFMARLIAEPTNPYDSNAVRVTDAETGATVGYLSRDLAKWYQQALLTHGSRGATDVPAVVRGGREEGHSLGVWLDLTQFNAGAGLPAPEQLANRQGRTDLATQAGLVDGIAWWVHRSQAVEAAKLGMHEDARDAFEKATRGWFAWNDHQRQPPTPATLLEEYVRWCRKAGRSDLELDVLRRYATHVARHEVGSVRCERMSKRFNALNASTAAEAPF